MFYIVHTHLVHGPPVERMSVLLYCGQRACIRRYIWHKMCQILYKTKEPLHIVLVPGCPLMRPHTLRTRILDTPWTPAIFPSIFRRISDRYSIISTFSCLFQLLDIRAISHVDRTATVTYYQLHRSMLRLYS